MLYFDLEHGLEALNLSEEREQLGKQNAYCQRGIFRISGVQGIVSLVRSRYWQREIRGGRPR